MTLLFTTSTNAFSWLIRKVLGEPVSHFAIGFDLNINGIVFHSNLKGSHIEYAPAFLKKSQVIYQIDIPMTLEQEETLYKSILEKYSSQTYDIPAFIYFTYRVLVKRLFGIRIPDKNEWQKAESLLCTGLAEPLRQAGYLTPTEEVQDFEMITPYQIYKLLSEKSV